MAITATRRRQNSPRAVVGQEPSKNENGEDHSSPPQLVVRQLSALRTVSRSRLIKGRQPNLPVTSAPASTASPLPAPAETSPSLRNLFPRWLLEVVPCSCRQIRGHLEHPRVCGDKTPGRARPHGLFANCCKGRDLRLCRALRHHVVDFATASREATHPLIFIIAALYIRVVAREVK